jgi:hypothetical protein
MVLIRMQPIILLLKRNFFKDFSKIKSMMSAYLKCHIIGIAIRDKRQNKNKYHG